MDQNLESKIKDNDEKIYKLQENQNQDITNTRIGMFAIFGTGVVALASIVTPIPIYIGLGAYAAANLYTFGSFFHGIKLEEKIGAVEKENKELKNKKTIYDKMKEEKNKLNQMQGKIKEEKAKLKQMRSKLKELENLNEFSIENNNYRVDNEKRVNKINVKVYKRKK